MPTAPCPAARAAFPLPRTPNISPCWRNGAGGLSIALVDASACRIEAGLNLGGDGSDTVTFNNVAPVTIKPAPKGFDQTALMLMGGVARSLQIAGALESMLDISVRYSNERVAFEKKISKFQAVQHNLARLAGESAAALAAATSAADAIANSTSFDDAVFLEAASAKIRCSEAAEKGAAIAHQVHGAIGFTIEHILHRYTLRALAWRDDFGSESYWAVELGKLRRRARRRRIVAAGGVALRSVDAVIDSTIVRYAIHPNPLPKGEGAISTAHSARNYEI